VGQVFGVEQLVTRQAIKNKIKSFFI